MILVNQGSAVFVKRNHRTISPPLCPRNYYRTFIQLEKFASFSQTFQFVQLQFWADDDDTPTDTDTDTDKTRGRTVRTDSYSNNLLCLTHPSPTTTALPPTITTEPGPWKSRPSKESQPGFPLLVCFTSLRSVFYPSFSKFESHITLPFP